MIITLGVILSYVCFTEGNNIHKIQDFIKVWIIPCILTLYKWRTSCSHTYILYFNTAESCILNKHHVKLLRKKYPGYKSRIVGHQSITLLYRELGVKPDIMNLCTKLNTSKMKVQVTLVV